MDTFIHLRLHSEYSLEDGIVRIKPLVERLNSQNMPAAAITDLSNFFAAVKFYKNATKAGIKPIFGTELQLYLEDGEGISGKLVFLCQDNKGYHNLTCLISKAYQEQSRDGIKYIKKEWIETYQEGLIVLSGGMSGPLGLYIQKGDQSALDRELQYWIRLFGDRFYLEISRIGREGEEEFIQESLKLSKQYRLPMVATNEVCFLDKEDFEAHEARVCIYQGRVLEDETRSKDYYSSQFLKSASDMQALFSDLPEVLANTVEIAKRCNVSLVLGKSYLPTFPTPLSQSEGDYLKQLAFKGLNDRLEQLFSEKEVREERRPEYQARLDIELQVINQMGFPGYFLIVADFIQWAKNHDIPVGPGRGSGAGSLVAYALKITDLDPLAFDLLFERFLNPERVSMPDFDIDFCMEGRDKVIEYVQEKYGVDSVSQIITFGTMAAKAVVRDVGRVLGHPYGFVDRIAKLIPFEIGMTLEKALNQEEALKLRFEEETEVFELLTLAKKLEGITRNAGKHAGGVVIAPSKLTDFTAIYCEPGSKQIVSQFDKDDVEAVGLVKFDFLGLRTLTIIHWALVAVNQYQEQQIDITQIPMDCEKTFSLLKACQTTAVFQLESRGMKELISRLKPDCFEEIIALVALFRPGPLQSGMVDDFIDRKHGRAKVIYPHPDLEPILKPTYGVILYQEQVMQIAQVLAGYSLGAADILRRAMGKKKPEEMAAQRKIFTEGATANGVEKETATYIFDLMEKFAGYGFNKSHSAAYALIAYQTAWLKAHYPSAFMAAVLSSDLDNTDKVVTFIFEAQTLSINILPPSVNHSDYPFVATKSGDIRYGLGAIKGVGESAINLVIEERRSKGRFLSLFDFCARLDLRKVNRRVIEALIFAGAFDEFGQSRETLFMSLEKAIKQAEKTQSNQKSGQQDLLFDDIADDTYVHSNTWLALDILEKEQAVLGFYFSAHPVDLYEYDKRLLKVMPLSATRVPNQKQVTILGLIQSVRKLLTKRGKKMAVLTIDDGCGTMDVTIFEEVLLKVEDLIEKNKVVVCSGEVSLDKFSGGLKLLAKSLDTVHSARETLFDGLQITLHKNDHKKLNEIKELLLKAKGTMPIRINYQHDEFQLSLKLKKNYSITPSDELLFGLKSLISDKAYSFI